MVISLIFIILAFTKFKNIELPTRMIRQNKEKELISFFNKYMSKDEVIKLINSMKKSIIKEDETEQKIKHSFVKKNALFYTEYKNEMLFCVVIGFVHATCYISIYTNYEQLFLVHDIKDESEVHGIKILQSSKILLTFVVGIIAGYFNVSEFRKGSYLRAILFSSIVWGSMGLSFYNEMYFIVKLISISFTLLGVTYFNSFKILCLETCGKSFMSYTQGFY